MDFSANILANYTYEEYLHWEGKWKLIDGFPIAATRYVIVCKDIDELP